MKLKAIELLNHSLQLPDVQNPVLTQFNFNIGIESKIDAINKFIFVIVNIDIKNDDLTLHLGALSASCIFEIANFEEVIKIDTDGKADIPQIVVDLINSISISTVRGIMFSTFKGTFLHNAVLPIIDIRHIQSSFPGVEKK